MQILNRNVDKSKKVESDITTFTVAPECELVSEIKINVRSHSQSR